MLSKWDCLTLIILLQLAPRRNWYSFMRQYWLELVRLISVLFGSRPHEGGIQVLKWEGVQMEIKFQTQKSTKYSSLKNKNFMITWQNNLAQNILWLHFKQKSPFSIGLKWLKSSTHWQKQIKVAPLRLVTRKCFH